MTNHGGGHFTLAMDNKTTGKKSSTGQRNDVSQSRTAEVVVEQPSDKTGGKISLMSFAACESVRFTSRSVHASSSRSRRRGGRRDRFVVACSE